MTERIEQLREASLKAVNRLSAERGLLIVRVAGYSDYFNDLGPELQEEIIRRTEHLSA